MKGKKCMSMQLHLQTIVQWFMKQMHQRVVELVTSCCKDRLITYMDVMYQLKLQQEEICWILSQRICYYWAITRIFFSLFCLCESGVVLAVQLGKNSHAHPGLKRYVSTSLALENNLQLLMNAFHQSTSQLAPISIAPELHKTLVHVSSVHVSNGTPFPAQQLGMAYIFMGLQRELVM